MLRLPGQDGEPLLTYSDALVNECYHLDLTSSCPLNRGIMFKAGNEVHLSIYSTGTLLNLSVLRFPYLECRHNYSAFSQGYYEDCVK